MTGINGIIVWSVNGITTIIKNLRKDLEAIDFKVKPYGPCLANNMIHDKQIKINWHIYDFKLSHDNNDIV